MTGSSTGFGRAMAEVFAREGAAVVVNGRRAAFVDDTVSAIRASEVHGMPSGSGVGYVDYVLWGDDEAARVYEAPSDATLGQLADAAR
ncbi:MAG TPA: hypothetical protein VFN21_03755 [Acidimicrobiales bacterium]|nr:hypothetical protein [Acidimicrobiales bacterium]